MGSSRSFAADQEDEVTICKYGQESLYFDSCQCKGCNADREEYADALRMSETISSLFLQRLMKLHPSMREDELNRIKKEIGG